MCIGCHPQYRATKGYLCSGSGSTSGASQLSPSTERERMAQYHVHWLPSSNRATKGYLCSGSGSTSGARHQCQCGRAAVMQGIRWQPTEQQAHLQYLCELLRLLLNLYLELGAQSLHRKAVRGAAGAVQQGCDRVGGVVEKRDLGRQRTSFGQATRLLVSQKQAAAIGQGSDSCQPHGLMTRTRRHRELQPKGLCQKLTPKVAMLAIQGAV